MIAATYTSHCPQAVQGEDLNPIFNGEKESVQNETLIELKATKKIYQQSFITDPYKQSVPRSHHMIRISKKPVG